MFAKMKCRRNTRTTFRVLYQCVYAADMSTSHSCNWITYFDSFWHCHTNTAVSCISACNHSKKSIFKSIFKVFI